MPVELFANFSSTVVTSGGTTAPVSGTIETWSVQSSATFPAASSTANPTTQFRVTDKDPTKKTEIILVTNVSVNTWSVTRGAEGTIPVAHTPNWSVEFSYTAGNLFGAVSKGLFTAKGMVLVASGLNAVSGLAVGADGTRLVSDSTAPLGVSWGASAQVVQPGLVYRLIWNGTAYVDPSNVAATASNRVPNTYRDFIGPNDPNALGLMINGDVWKPTT